MRAAIAPAALVAATLAAAPVAAADCGGIAAQRYQMAMGGLSAVGELATRHEIDWSAVVVTSEAQREAYARVEEVMAAFDGAVTAMSGLGQQAVTILTRCAAGEMPGGYGAVELGILNEATLAAYRVMLHADAYLAAVSAIPAE